MIGLLYNISPLLKDSLRKIAILREKILLTPLSPKTELKLRWEANFYRLYWSLQLSGNTLTKKQIQKIYLFPQKKLSLLEQEVVNYKKALDYISQNWLVTSKTITPEVFLTLNKFICPRGRFHGSEKELKQFLAYLQVNPDYPIITAALIQTQVVNTNPFQENNGLTSRLLVYLMLYKNGYDFRGLLSLEEYWHRDFTNFQENIKSAFNKGNFTLWLEYFSHTVCIQLENAYLQCVSDESIHSTQPASFWQLNDRQKEILNILEQPDLNITNRKVQKLFKVSQITASRDLAKLVSLGLLFTHGKGRSVYYTRV